jgi:hypothetical protein
MRETLVAHFLGNHDDLRPLSPLGQQTREVVEVDSEFAMVIVELNVAGLKRAGPNERSPRLSRPGRDMATIQV